MVADRQRRCHRPASVAETPLPPAIQDSRAALCASRAISRYFLTPSKLEAATSARIYGGCLASLDPGSRLSYRRRGRPVQHIVEAAAVDLDAVALKEVAHILNGQASLLGTMGPGPAANEACHASAFVTASA